MKFKTSLFLGLTLSITLGGGSFWYYQHLLQEKESQKSQAAALAKQSIHLADNLLNREHPLQALRVLQEAEKKVAVSTDLNKKWEGLALKSAVQLQDTAFLEELYRRNPSLFTADEKPALLLAEEFLNKGDFVSYKSLFKAWKEKTRWPAEWILLEADALALQGKSDESVTLLKTYTFQGKPEVRRVMRLAILTDPRAQEPIVRYFKESIQQEPKTDELRYFLAKYLEANGKHEEATAEYKTLLRSSSDPFIAEDYVQLLLENGRLEEAWRQVNRTIQEKPSVTLELKGLFISKVYKPLTVPLVLYPPVQEPLPPYLRYLLALPEKGMWAPDLFYAQSDFQEHLQKNPEHNWLPLIYEIKQDHGLESYKRLLAHPEMGDIAPNLYNGMVQLLAFQNPLSSLKPHYIEPTSALEPHPFFSELSNPSYSRSLQNLLQSPFAYAAIFLAAGWNEAALYLLPSSKLPDNLPSWFPYGIVYAIAANRSSDEALQYLATQPEMPALNLAKGELLLAAHRKKEAEAVLQPLATQSTSLGAQAAYQLARLALDNKNYAQAKALVVGHPLLASQVKGKEILAFVAVKEHNLVEAEKIYRMLGEESTAGLSFASQKAIQDKDYLTARVLTEKLLERFPDNIDLQKQLQQVKQNGS